MPFDHGVRRPKWAKHGVGAVLFDLAVECEFKKLSHRPEIRKQAVGHQREAELIALLDEEERSRREFFQARIREMLEARIEPTCSKYKWFFGKYCGKDSGWFYNGPFHGSFSQDEWRWLAAVLEPAGWVLGGSKKKPEWRPPEGWVEDKSRFGSGFVIEPVVFDREEFESWLLQQTGDSNLESWVQPYIQQMLDNFVSQLEDMLSGFTVPPTGSRQ